MSRSKVRALPVMRCHRCHQLMIGTTAYDGACDCGGLVDVARGVQPDPAVRALIADVAEAIEEYGDDELDTAR